MKLTSAITPSIRQIRLRPRESLYCGGKPCPGPGVPGTGAGGWSEWRGGGVTGPELSGLGVSVGSVIIHLVCCAPGGYGVAEPRADLIGIGAGPEDLRHADRFKLD